MTKMMTCSPENPNIPLVYRAILWVSIGVVGCALTPVTAAYGGETQPKGLNAYQMVTGDDQEGDRSQWDALFSSTKDYVFGKEPAAFVRDHLHQLPQGRVLDVAMGEGRNAVFLAKKGYRVEGVDYSEVAIRKAKRLARENGVTITTVNADLNHYTIKPDHYDVIMVIQYLQRSLFPQIRRGLKKKGVLIFENYTVDQAKNAAAKAQRIPKDYLLEKGELRKAFEDLGLEIVYYKETNNGKEAVASLIARKTENSPSQPSAPGKESPSR
jgi:tellurite methyltransferase